MRASNDPDQAKAWEALRSSVHPEGRFRVALHGPSYRVANLRASEAVCTLGLFDDGRTVTNRRNFPPGEVEAQDADGVYEIANPFPFRGATYIGKAWADAKRDQPASIPLTPSAAISMVEWFRKHLSIGERAASSDNLLKTLPGPVQLALAVNSTDPQDLVPLAEVAADFIHDLDTGRPLGLRYTRGADGKPRQSIHDHTLFEAVANNAHLPDVYKAAMVLRPGTQGDSPIVGEYRGAGGSHVFEYLRRNSYIPWGHYAANMADDAVRYRLESLTGEDMTGMRHLYYQRSYVQLAEMVGLKLAKADRTLTPDELETLRQRLLKRIEDPRRVTPLPMNASLWGWNFGFDYAPSRYRLHASHQQIHQQYALIPREAPVAGRDADVSAALPAYACGDQIQGFIQRYREKTGVAFFPAYLQAVHTNQRIDGRGEAQASLIVHSDPRVWLFVPKAQTSQWELQIVTRAPVGNVLETDALTRRSLDRALLVALRTLGAMGARMVTTIEFSKRFDAGPTGQHLLYSLLPRLPESPGAFSEAQLRWIVGHYPEDFAAVCRTHKPDLPR